MTGEYDGEASSFHYPAIVSTAQIFLGTVTTKKPDRMVTGSGFRSLGLLFGFISAPLVFLRFAGGICVFPVTFPKRFFKFPSDFQRNTELGFCLCLPRRCALDQLSTSMVRSHQHQNHAFYSSTARERANRVIAILIVASRARVHCDSGRKTRSEQWPLALLA